MPYVGAGLAVTRVTFDPNTGLIGSLLVDKSSETDVGANVIGGATFGLSAIRPFAQARITKGVAFMNRNGDGGPGYSLMGGLLFTIGS